MLAIDLSDWRYKRFDLSLSGRNTLDAEVVELIEQLPEPVVVDVFHRVLEPPYDRVSIEVAERLYEILRVAMETRRDKLEVRFHDTADVGKTKARQDELGVSGVNFVLFSNESGTRKARQELFGDVAVIDWGNPTSEGLEILAAERIQGLSNPDPRRPYVPARLASFRGEEVLATSLLKVSSASSPRIYFATGQGEPSLDGSDSKDLTGLVRALEEDDFEVHTWNPLEEPEIPDDCAVLALIGATQPFPEGTLDRIRAWVSGGGRLFAAPSMFEVESNTADGIVDLLHGYGMIVERGMVCVPIPTAGGLMEGYPECAQILISDEGLSPTGRITGPLRERARRILFQNTAGFRSGGGVASGGMQVYPLVTVPSDDAWVDRPLENGSYDFRRVRGEWTGGKVSLVKRANVSTGTPLVDGEVQQGIVLGVASAFFPANGLIEFNRDFLLNAFNVLAERDYRVRVTPLPRPDSTVDLSRAHVLPVLSWSLYLGLPGLSILVGLVIALRRRG